MKYRSKVLLSSFTPFHTAFLSLITIALILTLIPKYANSAQVSLAWDPNPEPDIDHYNVYYGTTSKDYDFAVDVGKNVNYTISGLDSNETYFFAVTASDDAGNESAYSNEVSTSITTNIPPEITTPAPNSTLLDSTVTFQWTDNGMPVAEWWLWVGTSPGARDVYNSLSLGTNTSHTIHGLPADGSLIYIRLWFLIDGDWQYADFPYTAVHHNPSITNPAPGSALTDSTVTFQWTNNGMPVTEWWLWVGTSPGARDVYNSLSLGTSTSHTIHGLPTDGSLIYIRLWFLIDGDWQYADFPYTATFS